MPTTNQLTHGAEKSQNLEELASQCADVISDQPGEEIEPAAQTSSKHTGLRAKQCTLKSGPPKNAAGPSSVQWLTRIHGVSHTGSLSNGFLSRLLE